MCCTTTWCIARTARPQPSDFSASVRATWGWTNAPVGPLILKATATDNAGAATSTTVTFTVNAAPYAVITAPLPCSEIIWPADVTLAADAFDADGSVARVDFYNATTLLGSAERAPYRLVWTRPPVGNYSLTAVALDNLGASRASPRRSGSRS